MAIDEQREAFSVSPIQNRVFVAGARLGAAATTGPDETKDGMVV